MTTAHDELPLHRIQIGLVTHYMPPHFGGIETVAELLFHTYQEAGGHVRWIASRTSQDREAIEPHRIRVRCWNVTERWFGLPWPVWGFSGVTRLAQLVRWADVLHVHDCLFFGSVLATFFAWLLKKPVVLSQHNGFLHRHSVWLKGLQWAAYTLFGRAVFKSSSRLILHTSAAKELVELLHLRHHHADYISVGINADRFRPPSAQERVKSRRHFQLPLDRHVVLFVGRLVEKKGADLIPEMYRRRPADHFFVVGEGPYHPHPAPNVTWVRAVPQELLPAVYWSADALIMPSHSEEFPLVVREAMSSGLPVLIPRGGVLTEQLEREGACLVVERTPVAFCEALERLWQSPELSVVVSERARRCILQRCSLRQMVDRHVDLLADVAGNR